MSLELDKQKTIQMRTNKHKIQRGYSKPYVRLIELESEAPLLAGSVDLFMGDTGPNPQQPGGISLEDFGDGGQITL